MDLHDGNLYRSILVRNPDHDVWRLTTSTDAAPSDLTDTTVSVYCSTTLRPQVTSNDKTPTVISSALEKHNQDPKHASRYELIQLLPEGKGEIRGEQMHSDQFDYYLFHSVQW